jgi:hypothetical protein
VGFQNGQAKQLGKEWECFAAKPRKRGDSRQGRKKGRETWFLYDCESTEWDWDTQAAVLVEELGWELVISRCWPEVVLAASLRERKHFRTQALGSGQSRNHH